ncbi:hypothetical protein ACP4OV_027527 [Aristida adscensionis]
MEQRSSSLGIAGAHHWALRELGKNAIVQPSTNSGYSAKVRMKPVLAIPGLVIIITIAIDQSNQIHNQTTYATVGLVSVRGLDVDEQRRTNPVEFDVSIGFLHLLQGRAVGHDFGRIAISYRGVRMAEGQVPKFFVAGGPKEQVEATRVVASAGKDQPPLS